MSDLNDKKLGKILKKAKEVKMRKLVIAVLCLFLSVSAFAGVVVKPFGGYTMVSNAVMNRMIDAIVESSWSSIPSDVELKKNYFRDAYLAGVDVAYELLPGFDVGVRGEYIGSYGEAKARRKVFPYESESFEFPAGTLPVLAGVSYTYGISGSPFSIGAEAYAGYGFANITILSRSTNYDGLVNMVAMAPCYGGGFVLDSAVKFAYTLSDKFALTLNTGYRQAKVNQIRAVKDTSGGLFTFTKNEVIEGPDGTPIVLDFSGLILNLALSINF